MAKAFEKDRLVEMVICGYSLSRFRERLHVVCACRGTYLSSDLRCRGSPSNVARQVGQD